MTTFIYALKDPDSGRIRYLGKADDPYWRYERHLALRFCEQTHKAKWLRWLSSEGKAPVLEILDEVPKDEWQFWEKEWIRLCRALGFKLVNGTDGGDGVAATPEVRQKISESQKGEKSFWFGKKQSPELVAKRMDFDKAAAGAKASHTRLGKKRITNTSGFSGVTLDRRTNKWVAEFKWHYQKHWLGSFYKLEDAVFVYALATAIIRLDNPLTTARNSALLILCQPKSPRTKMGATPSARRTGLTPNTPPRQRPKARSGC